MWIKWKRRDNKVLLALEDKNFEKNYEENDKKLTWGGSVEEGARESFLKKYEQCDEHVRKAFF